LEFTQREWLIFVYPDLDLLFVFFNRITD